VRKKIKEKFHAVLRLLVPFELDFNGLVYVFPAVSLPRSSEELPDVPEAGANECKVVTILELGSAVQAGESAFPM